jgi:hypothetical protein
MTQMETASPEALASLLEQKNAALSAYSTRYAEREDAERRLADEAKRYDEIVRHCSLAERTLAAKMQSVIEDAIKHPAKVNVSELTNLRCTVQILERAARYHLVYLQSDARTALLTATCAELAAQVELQKLVREVHDAQVLLSLAAAAEVNQGDVEVVNLDGKSKALGELVFQVQEKLAEARQSLRTHLHETQVAKENFAEEITK